MFKFVISMLDKERSVANYSYNRWLVPPAALAVHLCIGMAYGFSVFWLPLSRSIGVSTPIACPPNVGFLEMLFTRSYDWKISLLGWTYTFFFLFLGSAAAVWGKWLERAGPRKAGILATMLWCGGLLISAVGVYWHQLWLLWLGSGVIGGMGLGIGYISPVSNLIKWFPDHRGMATGLAIMGFGGGAMIGAPLSNMLIQYYETKHSVGVWETFVTLAFIYFIFMALGSFGYKVPPSDWAPEGWKPSQKATATTNHVHLDMAWKTPQFWLLWWNLCLNVTAGIGVIGMASPMLQEIFGGKLIGLSTSFYDLTAAQKNQIAVIAAGFTGLLSLFNIGGRFFWASLSDYIGRKATYFIIFALGFLLYALVPYISHAGSIISFTMIFCIIFSMYGGGFATIPAYIADIFGTKMVGAIHGRLLTAWSAAGIFGPITVNYLREYQLSIGLPEERVYDITFYVLSSFLIVGFICNLLIKPVDSKYHMEKVDTDIEQHSTIKTQVTKHTSLVVWGIVVWSLISIPLLFGVYNTLSKVRPLFGQLYRS